MVLLNLALSLSLSYSLIISWYSLFFSYLSRYRPSRH